MHGPQAAPERSIRCRLPRVFAQAPSAIPQPLSHSLSWRAHAGQLVTPLPTGKRLRGASIDVEVHRVVADRAGFRGVFPLVRGLGRNRDHVALAQMMTHPALDTASARLAGALFLWVDQLAAGDEVRFAILDNEHVVGVVVHLRAALHDALGDDDQTLILEDALTLGEAGRNLVVVYVVDTRRKPSGPSHGYQGHSRKCRCESERVFHERSPYVDV